MPSRRGEGTKSGQTDRQTGFAVYFSFPYLKFSPSARIWIIIIIIRRRRRRRRKRRRRRRRLVFPRPGADYVAPGKNNLVKKSLQSDRGLNL
jgi:hypothetical protein